MPLPKAIHEVAEAFREFAREVGDSIDTTDQAADSLSSNLMGRLRSSQRDQKVAVQIAEANSKGADKEAG